MEEKHDPKLYFYMYGHVCRQSVSAGYLFSDRSDAVSDVWIRLALDGCGGKCSMEAVQH